MNTYTVRTWFGVTTQVEATTPYDALTLVFGALQSGHRVTDTDEGTYLTYSDEEGTDEIAHVTLYRDYGVSPLPTNQHSDYVRMASYMTQATILQCMRPMLARVRNGHPEVLPVLRIMADRLRLLTC